MPDRLPVLRQPGEGRCVAVAGDVYRILASGEETDGKYATLEAVVPPGGGPPPHTHSREEESFLILEGEITFQVGEKRFVATPGTFANMPVGTLHCFKNETNQRARMIISVAPSGFENMLLECGQAINADDAPPPPPSKAEIERLLSIAPRYGIAIQIPHA